MVALPKFFPTLVLVSLNIDLSQVLVPVLSTTLALSFFLLWLFWIMSPPSTDVPSECPPDVQQYLRAVSWCLQRVHCLPGYRSQCPFFTVSLTVFFYSFLRMEPKPLSIFVLFCSCYALGLRSGLQDSPSSILPAALRILPLLQNQFIALKFLTIVSPVPRTVLGTQQIFVEQISRHISLFQ